MKRNVWLIKPVFLKLNFQLHFHSDTSYLSFVHIATLASIESDSYLGPTALPLPTSYPFDKSNPHHGRTVRLGAQPLLYGQLQLMLWSLLVFSMYLWPHGLAS